MARNHIVISRHGTFSRGDEQPTVRMKTRIRVDSSSASRSLLLQGAGISVLDQFSLAEALQAGHLVRVLRNWTLPKGDVYAVIPPGRPCRPMSAPSSSFIASICCKNPGPGVEQWMRQLVCFQVCP